FTITATDSNHCTGSRSLTIQIHPQPSIQFSSTTYNVNRTGGSATIILTRTGGVDGSVTVSFNTTRGSATPSVDYTDTTGTLTFGPGDRSPKTLTIPILNNISPNGNKTVALSLNVLAGNARAGTPSTATLTIIDNNPQAPSQFEFSASSY